MSEIVSLWAAVTFYAVASCLYICGLVFKKERFLSFATGFAALGLVPHTVAIALRWIKAGHGPYLGAYEISSVLVWLAVIFFLIVQHRYAGMQAAGAIILPISFLLMGLAIVASKEISEVSPALQSYWLIIHVVFTKLAVASFLIATGVSGLYLVKEKHSKSDTFYMRLPRLEFLDDLSYRFAAVGFIFFTIMITSGAIWANKAWGRYWGWDPIETWSLIAWMVYAFLLHLRLNVGWRGRKAAWLTIVALAFALFAYFGVAQVYKTIHGAYF